MENSHDIIYISIYYCRIIFVLRIDYQLTIRIIIDTREAYSFINNSSDIHGPLNNLKTKPSPNKYINN